MEITNFSCLFLLLLFLWTLMYFIILLLCISWHKNCLFPYLVSAQPAWVDSLAGFGFPRVNNVIRTQEAFYLCHNSCPVKWFPPEMCLTPILNSPKDLSVLPALVRLVRLYVEYICMWECCWLNLLSCYQFNIYNSIHVVYFSW